MTASQHAQVLASFTPVQLLVLRVSIAAERRLRTNPLVGPNDKPALEAAYEWARENVL